MFDQFVAAAKLVNTTPAVRNHHAYPARTYIISLVAPAEFPYTDASWPRCFSYRISRNNNNSINHNLYFQYLYLLHYSEQHYCDSYSYSYFVVE